MATLTEQITAIEAELEKILENGQEIQSEHYRLKRADLKKLYDVRAKLQAENSGLTLNQRLKYGIPYRA